MFQNNYPKCQLFDTNFSPTDTILLLLSNHWHCVPIPLVLLKQEILNNILSNNSESRPFSLMLNFFADVSTTGKENLQRYNWLHFLPFVLLAAFGSLCKHPITTPITGIAICPSLVKIIKHVNMNDCKMLHKENSYD